MESHTSQAIYLSFFFFQADSRVEQKMEMVVRKGPFVTDMSTTYLPQLSFFRFWILWPVVCVGYLLE